MTRAPDAPSAVASLRAPPPVDDPAGPPRVFAASDLFAALQRPAVPAADQVAAMADKDAPNRFQDCWVWRGRPKWDDIFANVKKNRQHRDVGVCFCGSPAIGAALDAQCRKHSDARDDCVFTLHKENF